MIDYVKPEAARDLPGLRVALTRGAPAPYSMSARAVLDHHNVDYVAVEQIGAGANEALREWTRHRNAPVAVYNDEVPRAGWLDILNLAERLGSGPSLLPSEIDQRMQMNGLINELIGEGGMVWNLRLLMLGIGGPERAAKESQRNPMFDQYGYSEAARQQAQEKAQAVLVKLTAQAQSQSASGSLYLFGKTLSAADIYWAYFSLILKTLPQEQCPMPDGLRKSYEWSGQAVGSCDDVLIEMRDHTLANHLTLPMTF